MPWRLYDSCAGILENTSIGIKLFDSLDHVVVPESNHLGSGTPRGCAQAQHSHGPNTPPSKMT